MSTQAAASNAPGHANAPSTGIVWIASYPKSGNTWTRNVLHNLLGFAQGEGPGKEEEQDINAMNEYTTWDFMGPDYEKILGKPPLEATREEIARARPQVQVMIADDSDGLLLLKTHHALVTDRGYPVINGAATSGAVYIVRNPLDVAISFSHHMNKSIDDAIEFMSQEGLETEITEKRVYEVYGSWSENVYSWTRKPNRAIYVMRYEDMLADPKKMFGGLARHLLIPVTEAQVDKAIELSSFKNLKKQEEEKGFREKPKHAKQFFRSGKSGEWRETLTQDQIKQIVHDHRKQMARFGYLPDGY